MTPVALTRKPARVSGAAITRTRAALGLTVPAFAAVLGVGQSSVYRWESQRWPKFHPAVSAIVGALQGLREHQLSSIGALLNTAVSQDRYLEALAILIAVADPAAITAAARVK